MNIVFMGTPDFAIPSLKAVIDAGHSVMAIFTQTDKPKGRGKKLSAPPVKEFGVKYSIPIFQPKTLKTDESADQIRMFSPDLIVVVAYGKILPPAILQIPKYGCINVHASLLPKYRGAGPIQWSIINGESKTGVTTMFMGEGLDTGDILLQSEITIGENETAGELHDRLAVLGADLLIETIKQLEKETIVPKKQNDTLATYAPMLTKELSRLDFTRSACEIHNLIRGLSPWPCSETLLCGKRLKIYRSEIVHTNIKGQPGQILDRVNFVVACGNDTAVRFAEVQGEGSRRMSGNDFLRGHRISEGERLSGKEA